MQISEDFVNGFIAAGGIAVIIFAVKAFLMARANRASIDMIYRLIDEVESGLDDKIENKTNHLDNKIDANEVNVLRDCRAYIDHAVDNAIMTFPNKKKKKELLKD